jgi:hypothetical protein
LANGNVTRDKHDTGGCAAGLNQLSMLRCHGMNVLRHQEPAFRSGPGEYLPVRPSAKAGFEYRECINSRVGTLKASKDTLIYIFVEKEFRGAHG